MKHLVTPLVLLALAGCATLTPEGSRMKVIQDGAVMAMMDCQELGFVSGTSGLWGGAAGMDEALTEAKNKAARIPNANSMMITSRRTNPTAFVNATVYNCSERSTQRIEIVSPTSEQNTPEPIDQQDVFRRARLCQQSGGVWINDQCVIEIE